MYGIRPHNSRAKWGRIYVLALGWKIDPCPIAYWLR
jgi:hypothetical protein